MQFFEEKIRTEGKVFSGNILKVDSFLNHQADVELLEKVAENFFRAFAEEKPNKILTVEVSGIPLATLVASKFRVPMVFAKKITGANMSDDCYSANVYSFTKKKDYLIKVSKEYLKKSDRVLIVDDFLANGEALRGLLSIISQAGATAVGACIAIEKAFQNGGDKLRSEGLKILSAATIEKMDENGIVFRPDGF